MNFKKTILAFILAIIFLSSCATTEPRVSNNIVTLSDAPKISFSTSGWSYTNTSNPFLLTPDYLTNAMIGITRFKTGDEFFNNELKVPAILTMETIQELMNKRLKNKTELSMSHKTVGTYTVIVANYIDEGKQVIEYAFSLKGYLVHILLRAKPGKYFELGKVVAYKVVETMNPQ